MGHPQNEPTTTQTDNSTATGITNNTIKQRIPKAMDMIFHWVIYRTTQKQIPVYWISGDTNLADYHKKFHSPAHHKKQLPLPVHTDASPKYIPETQLLGLQGCVN